MFKIVAVTSRKLCKGNFLEQVEKIAKTSADTIILREKDLQPEEYRKLAQQVIRICSQNQTELILHSDCYGASMLGHDKIHLPLAKLREWQGKLDGFTKVGTSIHSVEEANEAQRLGADYVTAGHIFMTECKKGAAPRGISFLNEVIANVSVPVYAIGGIDPVSVKEIRKTSAAGACFMSLFMETESPEHVMNQIYNSVNLTGR